MWKITVADSISATADKLFIVCRQLDIVIRETFQKSWVYDGHALVRGEELDFTAVLTQPREVMHDLASQQNQNLPTRSVIELRRMRGDSVAMNDVVLAIEARLAGKEPSLLHLELPISYDRNPQNEVSMYWDMANSEYADVAEQGLLMLSKLSKLVWYHLPLQAYSKSLWEMLNYPDEKITDQSRRAIMVILTELGKKNRHIVAGKELPRLKCKNPFMMRSYRELYVLTNVHMLAVQT
jgi:hypothetical protein